MFGTSKLVKLFAKRKGKALPVSAPAPVSVERPSLLDDPAELFYLTGLRVRGRDWAREQTK